MSATSKRMPVRWAMPSAHSLNIETDGLFCVHQYQPAQKCSNILNYLEQCYSETRPCSSRCNEHLLTWTETAAKDIIHDIIGGTDCQITRKLVYTTTGPCNENQTLHCTDYQYIGRLPILQTITSIKIEIPPCDLFSQQNWQCLLLFIISFQFNRAS